jgi:hypothetical protein
MNVRTLIDSELLITKLMERDLGAEHHVAADVDVDTIDELPAITYTATSTGETDNGLDTVTLSVNVFAESIDEAFRVAQKTHNVIWTWDADPSGAMVDGVGWIQDVEDVSTFSRVGTVTVMVGRSITQYVGVYTLTLRSNN